MASSFSNGAARVVFRPVTISALRPRVAANEPTSLSVPAPKMMRVAVANSKRRDGCILHAAARLGHHVCHCLAPLEVMRSLLVFGRCVVVAIDFHQHKARGIILLLGEVE